MLEGPRAADAEKTWSLGGGEGKGGMGEWADPSLAGPLRDAVGAGGEKTTPASPSGTY